MLPPDFIEECIRKAYTYYSQRSVLDQAQQDQAQQETDDAASSATSVSGFSSLSLGGDASSSATSYTDTRDPHAVSNVEARSYYAGLPSRPTLLYRTGEKWSPPSSPQTRRRRKELCKVFNHPIADLWNDGLCWEVVEIMDNHKVLFTSMDIIRFKMVEVDEEAVVAEAKKPVVSPVTIWVGVYPGTTSATAAYNAAQAILALLRGHEITDVDVDFRESF